MSKNKNRRVSLDLYVDIVLMAAFLIAMKPFVTGIAFHEWLGLALGGGLVLHAILHWRWIVSVTCRFFAKLPLKLRVYYLLDLLLLGAFTVITLSGVLISRVALPFFRVQGGYFHRLAVIHSWTSYVTLGLLIVKLVLHWTWIKNAIKCQVSALRNLLGSKQVCTPPSLAFVPLTCKRETHSHKISRRHFLLLGFSAACIILLASINKDRGTPEHSDADSTAGAVADPRSPIAEAPVEEVPSVALMTTDEPSTPAPLVPTVTPTAVPTTTPSAPRGMVRCPYGRINDPYPGRCHRYRDANGNGLCDLSESA